MAEQSEVRGSETYLVCRKWIPTPRPSMHRPEPCTPDCSPHQQGQAMGDAADHYSSSRECLADGYFMVDAYYAHSTAWCWAQFKLLVRFVWLGLHQHCQQALLGSCWGRL